MDYTILQVARAEHEERVGNLPRVLDYPQPPVTSEPGKLQKQSARVLVALGSVLMALGQRISQDVSRTPAPILTERPCVEC